MYITRWSYTLITSGTKKVKRKRYNSYRSKAVPSCRWKTVYCFSVLYMTFFSPIKEYDHSGEESMYWKVSNIDWSFNKVIIKSRCINFDYHFVYRNVSHAPRPVTIIFSSFLTRRVTLPNQLLFQGCVNRRQNWIRSVEFTSSGIRVSLQHVTCHSIRLWIATEC